MTVAVPLPGHRAGGRLEIPQTLGFATALALSRCDSTFYGPSRCPIHHCITRRPNSPRWPSAILPPGVSAFSCWSWRGHFVPGNTASAESFPELLRKGQPCASAPLARSWELLIKGSVLHIINSRRPLWGYLLPNGCGLATQFKTG